MSDSDWDKGMRVFDAVYGPGSSAMMESRRASPFSREIVENQFGKLWGDKTLSFREKRLLVLGATTMLGRQDLIETQMTGALINGEFTAEQLEHIQHFMLFYAGAGKCTALVRGIEAAQAKVAAMKPK